MGHGYGSVISDKLEREGFLKDSTPADFCVKSKWEFESIGGGPGKEEKEAIESTAYAVREAKPHGPEQTAQCVPSAPTA